MGPGRLERAEGRGVGSDGAAGRSDDLKHDNDRCLVRRRLRVVEQADQSVKSFRHVVKSRQQIADVGPGQRYARYLQRLAEDL